MSRPSKVDLRAAYGRRIPDLLGPDLRLLFCGINPGLWSGATGAHFARPGNRFWPALHAAGLLPSVVDASEGMSAGDAELVVGRGIGISNLVPRATARADEVTADELRTGAARLTRLVRRHRPSVVAVAGITAYRSAFGRPKARAGRQPGAIGDAEVWVVPNPSGLNAHETLASLAAAYAEVGAAAGIDVASS